MRILLVYPEFPDTFWSFKHALRFIHKKAASPPLGLLTVAAMLPPEWEKRLVDLNVTSLTPKDLAWADYVFISAMIVQREAARALIEQCKAFGVKMVAGGPLFTMEHEQFPEVDYFVLNEAELTLPLFLADLANGCAQPLYSTTKYPDIHLTPAPLWQLVNLKHYDTFSIQFSRGCPFSCDFCNVTALLGHRPRTKTATQIIAELDSLYALGWRKSIFFVDDNFIGNKKLIKSEILPALIEWRKGKTGMPFSTEVSINLVDDPELLNLMTQAGFDTVFVGIETPNEGSLTECSKNQNKGRDLVESVKQLQRAGLQVQGGFIVGFDNDPPSIFQQQIDFIQKSGIVTAMVGLLQAPPGTRLYDRMRKEGRLVNEMSGDNVDGSTNIIPKMGLEPLQEGYRKLLAQIYAPKAYYERVTTFLREYHPPEIRVHLDLQYVLALGRSIYRLGIRGVERVQYWRLFFWTLFRRPRLFPLAITLAIMGFHFRQVVELHIG
ncbi:MAG: B12-binding domain-containing radical SAM protein [Chloroflexi bacterium RBG_19FT_COMBO_50_10]|nr:MAG: B12-binding domain-containing radical SAM protein [Chloroflexi bacterium RBG_19FT_COMBO_50_10]